MVKVGVSSVSLEHRPAFGDHGVEATSDDVGVKRDRASSSGFFVRGRDVKAARRPRNWIFTE